MDPFFRKLASGLDLLISNVSHRSMPAVGIMQFTRID